MVHTAFNEQQLSWANFVQESFKVKESSLYVIRNEDTAFLLRADLYIDL